MRILVYDENATAADLFVAWLRRQGYDACGVYDGRIALNAARRLRPEVIILDVGLPGMDGYVVARNILDDSGLDRSRVIMVSGYIKDVLAGRPRESGFDLRMMQSVDVGLVLASLDSSVSNDDPDIEPSSDG